MHFACEKEKNLGGPESRPLLVELCPPTKHVQVLTPGVYERDLILKHSLCRCNLLQIRSFWVIIGPKFNDWGLYERVRNFRYTDAQGESHVKIKAKIIVMYPQARVPGIANRS